MEIKKVVEELEIANDINSLSEREIKEKYLVSEEKYSQFLKTYGEYFLTHLIYPLRAGEHLDKIAAVLKDGVGRYTSNESIAFTDKVLTELTNIETRYRVGKDSLGDERIEAQFLFENFVGDLQTKVNYSYNKILPMIYRASKMYSEKGNLPIRDFKAYVDGARYTSPSQYDYDVAIDHYIEDHPLMLVCNDTGFLYFANYMMNVQKKKVDEEFVRDVKDVMAASEVLQDIEYVRPNFNRKNYKKVAKFTKKTIKRFEKEQMKKAQDQGMAKKKTNSK